MYHFYQFVMVINSEKSSENNKVATLKATEQLIGETELLLFAEKFNTNFAVFCTEGKEEYSNGQEIVNYVVDNGINYNGIHYVPLMAGASAMRCAKFLMCDANIKDALMEHIHWDINTSNLSAAKESKYNALSMSVTSSWYVAFPADQFYGCLVMPNIDKVVVCKDATSIVNGKVDKVDDNKVVRMNKDIENKFTDGANIYIVDDRGLTEKQRKSLVKKLDAWSFRAPGFKGLFIPVLYTAVVAFMKQNNWNGIFTDNWGNEHHILGVQCICFNSSFKWSKCVDSWQQYVDGFKKHNHEFRVCVTAHNNVAAMPYQMSGMLSVDNSRIQYYADKSVEYVNKFTEEQTKLLSGNLRKACELVPEINGHFFVKQQKQINYVSKRRQVIGGKIPSMGRNLFAAPDPVCILQHIAGIEQTGIAAKHCICNKFEAGKQILAMRSPHLDWAYCIRNTEEPVFGLHCGNTMFFSVHDLSMSTMQMDYDGDHVFVTDNEHMVQDAISTIMMVDARPLEYDPMDADKKDDSGEEAFKTLLKSMVPAPIGMHALTIVKNVAEGMNRDVVRLQTRMANIIIDAATHGGRNTKGGLVDRQVEEYMTKNGKKHKLPMFHAYAKGTYEKDGVTFKPAKDMENYAFHKNYILDKHAAYVMFNTEEVLEQPMTWTADDYRRAMPMLTYYGKAFCSEVEANTRFVKLVQERKALYDQTNEECKEMFCKSYGEFVRNEIIRLAKELDITFERALDSIICRTMTAAVRDVESLKFYLNLNRVLWDAFGDDIVANIERNIENGYVCDDEYDDQYDIVYSEEDLMID